jgi:hypothetical protein
MADVSIEVKGLAELRTRFQKMPDRFNKGLRKTLDASLVILHENVPKYPAPPPDSTYIRTATLGRTLGVSMAGTKAGSPDIYTVKPAGGYQVATFGTRLNYAPYVIGEREQAKVHQGRWWTLLTVAKRSTRQITQAFEAFAKALADYLDKG